MQVAEHLCHYGDVASAVHHFIGKTVAQKMGTFAGIALAYACGMIYLIYCICKKEMGTSLNQYIQQEKLNLAKTLLDTEQMTITDIAELLHFCSQSYFTTAFTKQFGISPSQYRENR